MSRDVHDAIELELGRTLDIRRFAGILWEDLDTPISLGLFLRLKYGDEDGVAKASIDPNSYVDLDRFRKDYQAVSFLRKYEGLLTSVDRRQAGLDAFGEAEQKCSETNARILELTRPNSRAGRVLYAAKWKICKLLGPCPDFGSSAAPWRELMMRFGPGATTLVRRETHYTNKLCDIPDVTPQFARSPYFQLWRESVPGWDLSVVKMTHGSKLSLVPKSALTMRPICSEPCINGMVQKAFGSFLRDKLLKVGIDTRDQETNRRLVAQAYSMGLCTIDLSSASDTIAWSLVMELLPSDWFDVLDSVRSHRYLDTKQVWREFEKFSSMGNGFTFELETLIFWAIASACCDEVGVDVRDRRLSVFGDDIIVPSAAFALTAEVLAHAGFIPNSQKSFGPDSVFFESCGRDYWMGSYVRPVFVKKDYRVVDCYDLHNAILMTASEWGRGLYRDRVFKRTCRSLRHQVPTFMRFLGPKGHPGCFWEDLDVASPMVWRRFSRRLFRGEWVFKTFREKIRRRKLPWSTAAALYSVENGVNDPAVSLKRISDGLEVRSGTYFVKSCQSLDWDWLGPWT